MPDGAPQLARRASEPAEDEDDDEPIEERAYMKGRKVLTGELESEYAIGLFETFTLYLGKVSLVWRDDELLLGRGERSWGFNERRASGSVSHALIPRESGAVISYSPFTPLPLCHTPRRAPASLWAGSRA